MGESQHEKSLLREKSLTGSRGKPPLIGEVSAKQTEGFCTFWLPGTLRIEKNTRRGQDPALQSDRRRAAIV